MQVGKVILACTIYKNSPTSQRGGSNFLTHPARANGRQIQGTPYASDGNFAFDTIRLLSLLFMKILPVGSILVYLFARSK